MSENVQKGKLGEEIVHRLLKAALSRANVEGIIYDNIIVEYPSIYGYYGMMTAEIDHIVLTRDYMFIVETKKQELLEWGMHSSEWKLKSGKVVSNPRVQNQNHKKILCELLEITRETVITIECLLEQSFDWDYVYDINDFVFAGKKMLDYLTLLFSSKNDCAINYETLKMKLDEYVKDSSFKREIHKCNIEKEEWIRHWIKTHLGYHKFKLTDVSYCPECGSYLNFVVDKWKDKARGNVKKTKQCMIGCSGYRNGCRFSKFYNQFGEVEVVGIEERNDWMQKENQNVTVLDEYMELKEKQYDYERKINYLNGQLEKKKGENIELQNNLQSALEENRKQKRQYQKIIGAIYIKKCDE